MLVLLVSASTALVACYSSDGADAPPPELRAAPRVRLPAEDAPPEVERLVIRGPHEGALLGLGLAVSGSGARAVIAAGAPGFGESRGAAYVLEGPFVEPRELDSATLVAKGDVEHGRAGDSLALGDLNGDGVVELVLSAAQALDSTGRVYVVQADREGAFSVASADASIEGARAFDNLGLAVAVAPGLTGQPGTLWVGIPHSGSEYSGSALAFRGELPRQVELSAASAEVISPRPNAHAGTAIAAGCDADGDGEGDVLIGAWGDDAGETGGGAYVMVGPVDASSSLDVAAAVIQSNEPGAGAGTRVLLADVNDDGLCDALVGAPGAAAGMGAIYGFMAPLTGRLDVEDADFTAIGTHLGDGIGLAMASGDQDGDGVLDLWIGASGDDEAGPESGAVYLIYGPLEGTVTLDATLPRLLGDASGDQFGTALGAGTDLDGDGSHDLAVGAWGAFGLAGAVYVVRNP